MDKESQLEKIYSNEIYNKNNNALRIKFPVPKIESTGYTLFHIVWLFDQEKVTPKIKIYFINNIGGESGPKYMDINLSDGKIFITGTINYVYINENNKVQVVDINGEEIRLNNFEISSIIFQFDDKTYSPSIALHWTHYKIEIGKANFSLKGVDLCSEANPCIVRYVCVGGICERCHPSCFDCKNGVLSTDCEAKCNTHSTLLTPDRGSCLYGYVHLSQVDSFTIQDLVPPTRNVRLTISYWIYLILFLKMKWQKEFQ